jgi:acetyl esterase/lipase
MNEPAPPADKRLAYGDHPSQFVDFRYPQSRDREGAVLAVYIHGGFWRARIDLSHSGHPCAAIAAAGHLTASIEYRRAGEEGGGWPGTLEDVRRAVRFAREQCGSPPTVVLGHSAGGHLALCVAAVMPDLRRVIGLGPVANPRLAWELNLGSGAAGEFFGGNPNEFPERYHLHPPVCPVVLIHGTADDIVPIELSRSYQGGRLIEIEGADHFDAIDPQTAAFQQVLQAL